MSSSVQPAVPASAAPGPGLAPAPPEQPRSLRKWLILGVILAVVGIAWWAISARNQRQQEAAKAGPIVHTAKVAKGTLIESMRLAGTTSARNFANIVAPQMRGPDAGRALILIYLVKSGAFVKKGEVLARIDAQSIKDHADDVHAQVLAAEADIRKRQAEQAIEMENVRQQVRVAKAEVDKAWLDYKTAQIRTPIDEEILKLAVEEAEANYAQLEKNLPITAERQRAEVRVLEYTRDRHVRHRDRHRGDVEKFVIHAPMAGLAVMNQFFRSGEMAQIQEGDQVSPGQPFMKVVDLNSMQVDANVNQVDGEMLRIGQRASVGFDAFPGLRLDGTVVALGAMGVGGWRQNYFIRNIPVRVAIQGDDPRVIPDLSASGDVHLGEQADVLLVGLEAIHSEDGKDFVYIRKGNKFERREVKLGKRNDIQAAVLSGLKPGEEVALSAPTLRASR